MAFLRRSKFLIKFLECPQTQNDAGQSIGTLFDKSAARRLVQEHSKPHEPQSSGPELSWPRANGHARTGVQSVEGQLPRQSAPTKSAMASAKSEPREKAHKAREAARVLQSLDTEVRFFQRPSESLKKLRCGNDQNQWADAHS